MDIQTRIVNELALYGISSVSFVEVEETSITAIRITDQPYRDHKVVNMIAMDILRPLGVDVCGIASNARYDGDDAVGAVIHARLH